MSKGLHKSGKFVPLPLKARIGMAVKRHRQWRDMRQDELAEVSGIAQGTVSQIERGSDPSLTTLEKVSASLGMKLSDLIKLAEDMGDSAEIRERTKVLLNSIDKHYTVARPR